MESSLNMNLETRARDHNRFALALFETLGRAPNNLFISPYAIDMLLAMVYAGARGTTAQQMAKALQFTQDQQSLHTALSQIQARLQSVQEKGHITLHIANFLWPQQNTPFLASYTHLIRDQYGVTITPLDYIRPEKAREAINAWIDEKTNHKIHEIVPMGSLNPSARLVLTSAAYFKSDWAVPFGLGSTHTALFKVSQNEHIDVPMMHLTSVFRHGEIEQAQILEIPYAGKDLSMILILPHILDGLADVEKVLNAENLNRWLGALEEKELELFLPRFEMSSSILLCPALNALGMTEAFTDEADFSGMNGFKWLIISACLHKTLIHVDEARSEAAAPLSGIDTLGALMPAVVFRVDHPCLYLIRENSFGSILFMGRLVRPL